MGRHRRVVCEKCYRPMRSDHIARHKRKHEKYGEAGSLYGSVNSIASSTTSLNEKYESESDFSSVSGTPVYKPSSSDKEVLIKTLLKDDTEYKEKMELGKTIYEQVKEYNINEESIPKEYKEPLELYMKQKRNIDPDNVELRSWQESLLNYIKPTDREIIWVQGERCNEGKTWFQEFIESKFGWSRVICGMDIKLKKSSICHALRKRSLMTTDIFLFDVGKANTFDGVNYEVLEKIKNGRILASKFDSAELKLHTPNIVIVFSNDKPEVKQLAQDRWKIFKIKDDDLVDVTNSRNFHYN